MSRVGLIGENSIEYVDKLLDIWNAGNCAVLIDWRIPYQTAVEMMKEAGVTICFVENKWLADIEALLSEDIQFIGFERKSNSAELLPGWIYDKFTENDSREEAIIIYSSGTTGRAKGILLTHYAINSNAEAIIDYMRPEEDDCIYIAKTISHSSTITGELLVALKSRMSLVIAPTIVPPRFVLNNIIEFNASIICLNPTLLKMYTEACRNSNYDLKTLKTIYVSGEILNDKLYKEAHQIFKDIDIYNVYGLSEAGPRVAAQRKDCCKSNSVGRPLKNIEIAIANEQGEPVEDGEYGIIHVNTPGRFIGYVEGDKDLKSFYRGWLNTGDVGYWDEYRELHIVERVDDVIIIDSHKIYPKRIEKQILNCDFVKECAVVKITYTEGEFLTCLYTGKRNSEREIEKKLRKLLPVYEIPRRFIWCDTIPHTLNDKISKADIKSIMIHAIEKEKSQ